MFTFFKESMKIDRWMRNLKESLNIFEKESKQDFYNWKIQWFKLREPIDALKNRQHWREN